MNEYLNTIALVAIAVNLQLILYNLDKLRSLAEKFLKIKSEDY